MASNLFSNKLHSSYFGGVMLEGVVMDYISTRMKATPWVSTVPMIVAIAPAWLGHSPISLYSQNKMLQSLVHGPTY